MDSELIAVLVEKNEPDIQTIVETIGIGTLLKLMPNFIRIIQTVKQAETPSASSQRFVGKG